MIVCLLIFSFWIPFGFVEDFCERLKFVVPLSRLSILAFAEDSRKLFYTQQLLVFFLKRIVHFRRHAYFDIAFVSLTKILVEHVN